MRVGLIRARMYTGWARTFIQAFYWYFGQRRKLCSLKNGVWAAKHTYKIAQIIFLKIQ